MQLGKLFFGVIGFLSLCIGLEVSAQISCNTLGQNPETAFPVCGDASFEQASVNLCGGRRVPNPKCPSFPFTDINPYWYRFTCFKAGTLGFTIRPNDSQSDYDWQIFDITGRDPQSVFTDVTLTISSNWSGFFGNTGTTTNAVNVLECAGSVPLFSKMPDLIEGHTYLLLVSHFTNTQAGYKLDFGGGTAVITDTTVSRPQKATIACDGQQVQLKLNKRMRCNSLAANGSDFSLATGGATFTSATGVGCNQSFDFDSVVLRLSTPVAPGTYDLLTQMGSDGNTLLDLCQTPIQAGLKAAFTLLPQRPSLLTRVDTPGCAPNTIVVAFSDAIDCRTIEPGGSDFTISGPQSGVRITGVVKNCVNDSSSGFVLQLNEPLVVGGTYTVAHVVGLDGNASVNYCGQTTDTQRVFITVVDTVSADFDLAIRSNCTIDTAVLSHPGGNGINSYRYQWNDGLTSRSQNTARLFTTPGSFSVSLRVSNGVCSDSLSKPVILTNTRVKAAFIAPRYACPGDTIRLVDSSKGPVTQWQWRLGDGQQLTGQQPPLFSYNMPDRLTRYAITLVASAANGCADSVTQRIEVPNNCFIAVPSAFTPNGDGLNDGLAPINAYKAEKLLFRVYNRYGQLVWQTNDWTRRWNGTINGTPQQTGSYVWHLQYELNGKPVVQQGMVTLIR